MSANSRYSAGAMLFHWVIAGLVVWNWQLANSALEAATREEAIATFGTHKAVGMTILALSVLRLLWRLTHTPPPLPSNYANWELMLARASHILFYVLLIGLPLGGWLANSFSGREIDMFGMFIIPALPVGMNETLSETIFGIHSLGGKIIALLLILHVLGALKHTFVDKDGGIFRMLPFGKTGPRES